MLSIRRFPAARVARFARMYSGEGPQSTGNPQGFNKREKANEDLYVRELEKEQLKKLHEEISKREKELGDLKEEAKKFK